MTNDNNEERTLDLPNDINLPFFTYGIFKPGQLAHSKIKNHIYEYENHIKINYEMKNRDGVPILINKESNYHHTEGSVITFKKGHGRESYYIICKTLLRKLYEWKTIKINENEVNILFGVNPTYGSDNIENTKEKVSFDGKNDPFFKEAIKLIENNLKIDKDSGKIESFFELQMNYMLLWSAIDRYSSLKYNRKTQKENNKKFANQKAFKDGIKKYKDEYHMPVYSTDDLIIHEFNEEKPYKTLLYYYTLRCNVVHRGKSTRSDYGMLKRATEELLEIFKEILKNTFEENC